ncbi:hypothetical protein [Mesorhizobium japonicum]|uniref:hypothetical protein n=1 Tax=Mesorhizobium japonicum TaxID=2066070 RepID=UPI003B5B97FF
MASMIEFVLTGDQEAAKKVVLDATAQQGFTATAIDAWNFELTRGSNGLTIAFGALAGKNFYLKFHVGFSADAEGHLVARVSRDATGSALRGGALGAGRAASAFQQVADAIGAATTQAGVFASNRTIG